MSLLKKVLLIGWIMGSLCTVTFAQMDGQLLSLSAYLEIVEQNHPLAVQANLQLERAEANMLMARGGFDPKLGATYDHKSFDGKNYYSYVNAGVKVPTWFGIDLKAEYDYTEGDFIDPSDELPNRGLWAVGISVPLGRGLVLDERRAMLQQARLYNQATEQERLLLYNDLFYDAVNAYVQWQYDYAQLGIAQEGLELAQQRLVAIRGSFVNGDKPAIDTLESFIAVQTRQQELLAAAQEVENSRWNADNYLWIEGNTPLEIVPGTRPDPFDARQFNATVDSLQLQMNNLLASHPELLLYENKIAQLEVEQRLQREDLKPDVRLDFNPLIGATQGDLFAPYDISNYKFGASFAYPLLLRKERGKLELTKIKQSEAELQRSQKRQDLVTKLNIYTNNIAQLEEQLELLVAAGVNYQTLLRAEYRKFDIGESSIFLLNSRELKYLENQLKQLETRQKILKNRLGFIYSAGVGLQVY